MDFTTFSITLFTTPAIYDKQGLVSYKAYEDYRLFDDGYVESLSVTLKESEVHVYVGKVGTTMRTKIDDGTMAQSWECFRGIL